MQAISFQFNLTLMTCSGCGISYAVPEDWRISRTKDHKAWYCPNGCQRHYPSESDIERIVREKRESENALQAKVNEANHARLVAEKKAADAAKELKRVQSRVSRGVCSCCNRTFEDLARHMKSKHAHMVEGHDQKQIAEAKHAGN